MLALLRIAVFRLIILKGTTMHPLTRRLFFTNKVVIGKDLFGHSIEAEGLFFNWLGRNLPFVVIGAWVVLMLIFALGKV